jgi:hypothetical protein
MKLAASGHGAGGEASGHSTLIAGGQDARMVAQRAVDNHHRGGPTARSAAE